MMLIEIMIEIMTAVMMEQLVMEMESVIIMK